MTEKKQFCECYKEHGIVPGADGTSWYCRHCNQSVFPLVMRPILGATGEFPRGKLNPDDEGEIRLAITHRRNDIIIDFGKPVHWIGFPFQDAEKFVNLLIKQINEIRVDENSSTPFQPDY